MLDLVGRERTERIVLEPVIDRLSQEIKNHTDMVPVVKAIVEMEAFTAKEKRRKKRLTRLAFCL